MARYKVTGEYMASDRRRYNCAKSVTADNEDDAINQALPVGAFWTNSPGPRAELTS